MIREDAESGRIGLEWGCFELESLTDVWFVGLCSSVTRSDEGGQVGSWGV